MTIEDAGKILIGCHQHTLKDRAFGDREVTWTNSEKEEIAHGYFGHSSKIVTVGEFVFEEKDAYWLEDRYKTKSMSFNS